MFDIVFVVLFMVRKLNKAVGSEALCNFLNGMIFVLLFTCPILLLILRRGYLLNERTEPVIVII
jgi:hypothetical protein